MLVRDRAAEVGINLNTIFTALVLAGILWVGTTLKEIRDVLQTNTIAIATQGKDIVHSKDLFEKHLRDFHSHQMRKP